MQTFSRPINLVEFSKDSAPSAIKMSGYYSNRVLLLLLLFVYYTYNIFVIVGEVQGM